MNCNAMLRTGRIAAVLIAASALAAAAPQPAASAGHAAAPQPTPTTAPAPPRPRAPEIQAPFVSAAPAAGKGRLALLIGGNRRWCTYPDDRVVKPPEKPGTPVKRNEVYTFGYKFTVSAVRRGDADTPLMLFESPTFRTATLLPASKLGQATKPAVTPLITPEGDAPPKAKHPPIGPDTLLPRWDDTNRCVTLPERMDFDLDAGTYDVYVAFDLMGRENGWVHRSTAYLTDIPIEAARRTRLEGLVNLAPGMDRQVELESASIEGESAPSPTPGP